MTGLEAFVSDYTGTTNDRLKQLLIANGATEGAISDMWIQFFDGLGYTSGTVEDRMRLFLLSYTAAVDVGQTIPDLWSLVTGPYTAGAGPLLDSFGTDCIRAFSTRQLKSSGGVTNCMQVKKAVSATTQDFGFVDGLVDSAGIATFCGAENGVVQFWYDQSGASLEAYTPGFASTETFIYTSSAIDNVGGIPAVRSDSGSYCTTVTEVNAQSVFVVFKSSSNDVDGYDEIVYNAASSTNIVSGGSLFTGPGIETAGVTVQAATEDTAIHILSVVCTAGVATVRLDGTSLGTVNVASIPLRDMGGMTGNICEIVMYSSDQSANRADIEANMMTYWGV